MKSSLIILPVLIGCILIGCGGQSSPDNSSHIIQDSGIEGTWYGTVTNQVTVSWTGFNSASERQGELYWVIKRKSNGSYDFPNCRGENKDIEVVDSTFTFEDITYTIESDDVIRAEINREVSGQHVYVLIELNRINKDVKSIGSITGTWSEPNDTTNSSDIFCAEIGDNTLTTSNGDNIQEVTAFVGTGDDFSYLSSRTGTDSHEYIQIDYGGNELHGFSRNGFEKMEIDYDTSSESGFNVTFKAQKQNLELSGKIVVELNRESAI